MSVSEYYYCAMQVDHLQALQVLQPATLPPTLPRLLHCVATSLLRRKNVTSPIQLDRWHVQHSHTTTSNNRIHAKSMHHTGLDEQFVIQGHASQSSSAWFVCIRCGPPHFRATLNKRSVVTIRKNNSLLLTKVNRYVKRAPPSSHTSNQYTLWWTVWLFYAVVLCNLPLP